MPAASRTVTENLARRRFPRRRARRAARLVLLAIRRDRRTRLFAGRVRTGWSEAGARAEEILTVPRTVTLTASLAVTHSPMWPSRIESRRNRSLTVGRVVSWRPGVPDGQPDDAPALPGHRSWSRHRSRRRLRRPPAGRSRSVASREERGQGDGRAGRRLARGGAVLDAVGRLRHQNGRRLRRRHLSRSPRRSPSLTEIRSWKVLIPPGVSECSAPAPTSV